MAVPQLAEIASVYRDAVAKGEGPTRAVQITFEVPRSTAGRWVMAARHAGFLEPTTAGQAGRLVTLRRSDTKLRAVASALQIPAEDLRRAILEHANGDLRISS